MGYDMYHEEKPEEEVAAYEQALDRFQQAVNLRNAIQRDTPAYDAAQEQVEAAYNEMDKAQAYYFRLNIHGMSCYLDGMETLGMLDSSTTAPSWNDWPTDEGEIEKVRTKVQERPTGIPSHKFGSNDGWLVAPEEITAALDRYQKPGPQFFEELEIEEDYWDQWIDFLRKAVDRGGFRVY